MARLILESLARSSDLKKVGRFLKSLNNLDCYLADTDGSHVRGANRARSSEDSDLFLSTGANGVSISADKFPPVPKSVLEDAHIREDIVTYNWSEGGAVTVLPIIRDSLIGYVY
ncbi:MAG: hypothetical protein HGA80_02640, partial [Candidatus Omnitrophica bacterium]|nr:hypothetical protein [Candidatus Omnitrophota bacterium]